MQEAIRFRRLGLTGTAFDGVINIRAERTLPLGDMPTDVVMSHDFH